MRLCPQPVSTMNPCEPRCAGDSPLRPAAAEPPWAARSCSSDASQRCQTSSAKSDALSCAPLKDASHSDCIRGCSSLGDVPSVVATRRQLARAAATRLPS
eukprot:4195752-Pyramimonas_sp.AAC.1